MIGTLWVQIAQAWQTTGWVEILAASLAVLYLILAIKQRASCWVVSFVSACLYVWVLFRALLFMESALNAFYAAMAVYGYWEWTRRDRGRRAGPRGGGRQRGASQRGDGGSAIEVSRWPWSRNAAGVAGVVGMSLLSSFFLRRFTPAAWPFVDSMVTWSSVFATFLVARKVYDNWYWWLVIDSVTLCLSFARHLYVTTVLFALYLVMIVIGMREWRRSLPGAARDPLLVA